MKTLILNWRDWLFLRGTRHVSPFFLFFSSVLHNSYVFCFLLFSFTFLFHERSG